MQPPIPPPGPPSKKTSASVKIPHREPGRCVDCGANWSELRPCPFCGAVQPQPVKVQTPLSTRKQVWLFLSTILALLIFCVLALGLYFLVVEKNNIGVRAEKTTYF